MRCWLPNGAGIWRREGFKLRPTIIAARGASAGAIHFGTVERCVPLTDRDQAPSGRGMRPRELRLTVLIQARMRYEGNRVQICIRNISSRGLLAQAAAPPPRGAYVEIFMPSQTIVGRVAWSNDRRFGIETQGRLDVGAILKAASIKGPGEMALPIPFADRRSASPKLSAQAVSERLERSRRMSAAFQFGCIVACGVAAALLMASAVQETLSRPLESISSYLQQGR